MSQCGNTSTGDCKTKRKLKGCWQKMSLGRQSQRKIVSKSQVGNPHLHGAELKTEHTPNHALLSQPVRESQGKSYFIRTLNKMEVLQEEKRDEKTYYTCKPEGYFGILKTCPPAFLDQKISSLRFELSFLFKLLYDSSILYF